jgi:uncharacterized membrane protein
MFDRIKGDLSRERVDERDRWPDDVNVHDLERIASLVGGLGCVATGLVRRGWVGAALATLGGSLIHRGVTGHCHVYSALRVSTAHGVRGPIASVPHGQGIKVKHSITVRQSADTVYRVWRQLDNLPRFMRHIESVMPIDERRSRWRMRGPANITLTWDAELINDVPGELIAWRSLPGSQIGNAGSVRFERAVGGHATLVTLNLEYAPPAGLLGTLASSLFGANPQRMVEEDMARFKELLEVDLPRPSAPQRGRLRDIEDIETARQVLQLDDLTKNSV